MNKEYKIPDEDVETMAEIYKSLPDEIRTGWLMSGSMLMFSSKIQEQKQQEKQKAKKKQRNEPQK